MYRICLTYTLHVHHVHELREYLHCSSKTNLMLDLFCRGKLIIADFREASWQSQNKSFLEFKTTATFKKLKWLRNTLSESFILWIPYELKQLFSWFGGSDLILKERIDRKPIRLIASMITARHQRNDWKLHEFRILFVNKQILLKLHWYATFLSSNLNTIDSEHRTKNVHIPQAWSIFEVGHFLVVECLEPHLLRVAGQTGAL